MFVINNTGTYKWGVTVNIPTDGGIFQPQTFTAIFKRVTVTELKDLIEKEKSNDNELAKTILVGWEDVVNAEGQNIPFSEEALQLLLETPTVPAAICISFMDSISGDAAKRKN